MNWKTWGKAAGEAVGRQLGEAVRAVGKKTNNELIQEIGDGVEQTTKQTGITLGDLTSSAWTMAAGAIEGNESKITQGKNELTTVATDTAIGLGRSFTVTAEHGMKVVKGIATKDEDLLQTGAKALLYTAAVGTLSIGLFELVDVDAAAAEPAESGHSAGTAESGETDDSNKETDQEHSHSFAAIIETRNDDLAGQLHPETSVPYETQSVELPNGEMVEGVFPEFPFAYEGQLPESLYLTSDQVQFQYMNDQLAIAVQTDSAVASQFNQEQLEQILHGEIPDGYVWHHAEEPGRMELVDEKTHAMTGHTGGRALWGGGDQYR